MKKVWNVIGSVIAFIIIPVAFYCFLRKAEPCSHLGDLYDSVVIVALTVFTFLGLMSTGMIKDFFKGVFIFLGVTKKDISKQDIVKAKIAVKSTIIYVMVIDLAINFYYSIAIFDWTIVDYLRKDFAESLSVSHVLDLFSCFISCARVLMIGALVILSMIPIYCRLSYIEEL